MVQKDTQKQVVLVTGASAGIGAAISQRFARGGYRIVAVARRQERLEQLARQLSALTSVETLAADVTAKDTADRAVDLAIKAFGRLDCLINNAGWHPGHKPIDDFSVQDFRNLLDLNLVSIFAACKFALPHLRKVKGNIINMSSLVGAMGQLHATTYVATKGAITAFTKALAVDEAEHEVRVNSVSPGNVYTPLWQEAIDASADPAATRAEGEAAQLLGRMGTIEEAGRLCLYLAAEATFTTGVDHVLSGGAELGYGRKTRRE